MNINIRKIEKQDLKQVAEIHVNGWKNAYKNLIDDDYLNSLSIENRLNKLKKNYNTNGFLVATLNDEIVGFIRYIFSNEFSSDYDVDCEVSALYVKTSLKGNGIGTKLLNHVMDEFRKEDKKKMILWCLSTNESSIHFYEKMGGKIIGQKEELIGDKKYFESGFEFVL